MNEKVVPKNARLNEQENRFRILDLFCGAGGFSCGPDMVQKRAKMFHHRLKILQLHNAPQTGF